MASGGRCSSPSGNRADGRRGGTPSDLRRSGSAEVKLALPSAMGRSLLPMGVARACSELSRRGTATAAMVSGGYSSAGRRSRGSSLPLVLGDGFPRGAVRLAAAATGADVAATGAAEAAANGEGVAAAGAGLPHEALDLVVGYAVGPPPDLPPRGHLAAIRAERVWLAACELARLSRFWRRWLQNHFWPTEVMG